MIHPEIIRFIETIRETDEKAMVEYYTNGGCYRFFLILGFLGKATPWYDGNHVITELNGRYYDITGEVEKTDRHTHIEHWQAAELLRR